MRLPVVLSLTLLAACASSSSATGGSTAAATSSTSNVSSSSATSTRSSRDMISQAELEAQAGDAPDMYEAIRKLRPQFLQSREAKTRTSLGNTSFHKGLQVYIDDQPSGGTEILKQVRVNTVKEVRYLTGSAATTRYSNDTGDGVIAIWTKK